MKRILLALSIVAISAMCFAYELSSNGRSHYKAAMSLMEMASSVEDYKQVAQELETVKKSDPNHPDTYIQLCKIYGRIGAEEGDSYFTKAQQALDKYCTLMPNDTETYNDAKVLLDALKKKYHNTANNMAGAWRRLECGSWCAFFPASITINDDPSSDDMIVRFIGNDPDFYFPNSFKMSSRDNAVSTRAETEYGTYTIGRGSITDHDILVWHGDGTYGSNGGVTGYSAHYKSSKTATKECWVFYYRLKKVDNILYVYFQNRQEYYDDRGYMIFYQGGNSEENVATYTK